MTHTQKNERIKELEDNIAYGQSVIMELHKYLNSSKFRCGDSLDGYINISDVRKYLYMTDDSLSGLHESVINGY